MDTNINPRKMKAFIAKLFTPETKGDDGALARLQKQSQAKMEVPPCPGCESCAAEAAAAAEEAAAAGRSQADSVNVAPVHESTARWSQDPDRHLRKKIRGHDQLSGVAKQFEIDPAKKIDF